MVPLRDRPSNPGVARLGRQATPPASPEGCTGECNPPASPEIVRGKPPAAAAVVDRAGTPQLRPLLLQGVRSEPPILRPRRPRPRPNLLVRPWRHRDGASDISCTSWSAAPPPPAPAPAPPPERVHSRGGEGAAGAGVPLLLRRRRQRRYGCASGGGCARENRGCQAAVAAVVAADRVGGLHHPLLCRWWRTPRWMPRRQLHPRRPRPRQPPPRRIPHPMPLLAVDLRCRYCPLHLDRPLLPRRCSFRLLLQLFLFPLLFPLSPVCFAVLADDDFPLSPPFLHFLLLQSLQRSKRVSSFVVHSSAVDGGFVVVGGSADSVLYHFSSPPPPPFAGWLC